VFLDTLTDKNKIEQELLSFLNKTDSLNDVHEPEDRIEVIQRYYFEYTLLYSLFIPCLLLLVSRIRKGRGKRREEPAS